MGVMQDRMYRILPEISGSNRGILQYSYDIPKQIDSIVKNVNQCSLLNEFETIIVIS